MGKRVSRFRSAHDKVSVHSPSLQLSSVHAHIPPTEHSVRLKSLATQIGPLSNNDEKISSLVYRCTILNEVLSQDRNFSQNTRYYVVVVLLGPSGRARHVSI